MVGSLLAYSLFLLCFLLLSIWWAFVSDAPVTEMSLRAVPIRMMILVFLFFLFTGATTQPIGAVVTGSMEPAIQSGDMVISSATTNPNPVVDTTIYPANSPDAPHVFGHPGSIIVYQTFLDRPVTHRVRYRVEAGENWVEDANQSYIPVGIECADISSCPSPTSGYITRGDSNRYYDQVGDIQVVSSDDILGIVKLRVPELGQVAKFAYDRSQSTPEEINQQQIG